MNTGVFVENLIVRLIKDYGFDETELRTLVNEVKQESTTAPASIPSRPTVAKKAAASAEPCSKCAWVVKKKTGEQEVCGKNAKNELNGEWYCGTDSQGHYKSMLGRAAKEVVASTSAGTAGTGAKTRVATTAVKDVNAVVAPVLSKALQGPVVHKQSVIQVGEYHIIPTNRVLIDRNAGDAYGYLTNENTPVLTLSDEQFRYCQAHNIAVRQSAMPGVVTPAVAPKVANTPKPAVKAAPVSVATTSKVTPVSISRPAPPKPSPVLVKKAVVVEEETVVVEGEDENEEEEPDVVDDEDGAVDDEEEDVEEEGDE